MATSAPSRSSTSPPSPVSWSRTREQPKRAPREAPRLCRRGRALRHRRLEGVRGVREPSRRCRRGAHATERRRPRGDPRTCSKPDQRTTVATALRARIDEKLGEGETDGQRHREGFKRVAAQLMLSAFQVEKLKAMKKELLRRQAAPAPEPRRAGRAGGRLRGRRLPHRPRRLPRQRSPRILRDQVAHSRQAHRQRAVSAHAQQRDLLADLIKDGPYKVLLGEKAAGHIWRAPECWLADPYAGT